jgi:Peptidase S46
MKRLLLAGLALLPLVATADEGMWTYDNFPMASLEKSQGFKVSEAWLTNAQLSSARLAGGCSASFVSRGGLVMTNHHCAHSCIEQLSTGERDFVKSGFYAKTAADEVKCPEIEVDQLVSITDVTREVTGATAGKSGAEFFKAQRAKTAELEKACQTSPALRCEVVSLYRGGVYDLYRYRRYQDVRLVFAPEFAIAFFGGDPDNFMFPRYDLDVAFLRVYDPARAGSQEAARPAALENWFRWSEAGAKDGETTFVSGNPGGTNRKLTVAQLEYQRDTALPEQLVSLAEFRGMLTEYQHRGAEEARHSSATLFYVENSLKALTGRLEALQDRPFFESKVKAEAEFKAALARDPEKAATYLPAFEEVARAVEASKQIRRQLDFKERLELNGRTPASDLLHFARLVVRGAVERAKPNADRLREFADAGLPQLTQGLFSAAPIYPEFEIFQLTRRLTKLREKLGADDPFVKKVLGRQSPAELAERLVKGTRLADVAYRKQLWEGGQAAIDEAARTDAAIAFAQLIDADGREIRKLNDETIQPVLTRSQELIARAHFALEGTGAYPDATFTLRLSYGAVKGYQEGGKQVAPFTTIGGAFERDTGREPFALPRSWLEAEGKLDKKTPFNFVTTNDIIGGNSGSPVINGKSEIVGLIFDGNIQSLGGDYGFDASVNRAVAVHSSALLEALSKIYGADRVVQELRPGKKP